MHVRIHKWLGLTLATFLVLGLSACQSKQPTAEEGGAAAGDGTAPAATEAMPEPVASVPSDTFISVSIGEPESLDPAWTYETSGAGVEEQIYEGLTAFDREKPDEFVPGLATDWTVSDDDLTYTFNIRSGVTFHEGGTLEPHDIAYSLQRAMLQDRVDGPMWLFLKPIMGTDSIEGYALDQADISTDVPEGQDAPTLADVPDDVKAQVCEDVKAAVSADDDAGTVTLTVTTPTPWLLQLLSQPWSGALDQEWMTEQGGWDGDCATWTTFHDPAQEATVLFDKSNGTGPFMLGDWKKGQEIVLDANPNYWRTDPMWDGGPSGPAALKQVVLQSVDEWPTRLTKLDAGEADTVLVPRANIDQVADMVYMEIPGGDDTIEGTVVNPDGTLKLYKDYPLVSATAAMFNFTVTTEGGNEYIGSGALDGEGIPPDFFTDEHVRKAFNYCFDWDTFISDALGGEGFQTRGPIIEGLQGYSDSSDIYTYDPDQCKAELDQAWDGKLPEVGFKMTIAYNEGNAARETVARVLAENFGQIDPKYEIDVISLQWPTFLEARRAGKLPVSVSGWLEDYHDASNWVHPFMSSAGAYSRAQNFPADMQTSFDDLISQGVNETDASARDDIYAQLQKMAIDDAIDVFLYQATGRYYVNRAVQGWYNNPLAPSTYYYALSKDG